MQKGFRHISEVMKGCEWLQNAIKQCDNQTELSRECDKTSLEYQPTRKDKTLTRGA